MEDRFPTGVTTVRSRLILAVPLFLLTALSTLIPVAFALSGCGGTPAASPGKVKVAVSIAPLADLARQVGGEHVTVTTLVPPAASPHTYEPTPAQVKEVAQADVLALIGLGFEFWAEDVIESAANPGLVVVYTSEGIEVIREHEGREGEHEEHEGHEVGNPHVWLDPQNAMVQVRHIRDALVEADPAHRTEYEANAEAYLAQLEALDEEIAARVATWSHREFIAFHPSWVYFARRYGLVQAAVIERTPGKEPSPAEVAEIIETARRIGARAVFAEPQFSPRAAETIAAESGAQVLFLNPLGGAERPTSYLEMMRYNVGQMEKALK
ncbi:MAG TPA: zinc ABC transporter substrate-binding protein [Anaerolineae bacterium]|nr:zinc ABC transporter substrate-binding protein [Anaerolineae bacterium]